MKRKNIIIAVVVLAILALVAAIANVYANNKSNSDPAFDPTQPKPSTGSGSTPAVLDYNKKLGIGSRGEEVRELQLMYSKKFPSSPIVADGIFGAKTLNAVIVVMGFGTTSTTLAAFKAKIDGSTASEETKSLLTRVLGITF